jgi:hypothetical protein
MAADLNKLSAERAVLGLLDPELGTRSVYLRRHTPYNFL